MDEFSFPTVASEQDSNLSRLPFPHFASSPLWFVSSTAGRRHPGRRCSSADQGQASNPTEASKGEAEMDPSVLREDGGDQLTVDDEERMDMLWENFNEELWRVACDGKRGDKAAQEGEACWDAAAAAAVNGSESDSERHSMVEFGCAPVLGVSKTGSIIQRRRPSLLLLLKVLKKLFLIQKTRSRSPERAALC